MIPLGVVQADAVASGYVVNVSTARSSTTLRALFNEVYPAATPTSGDIITFVGTGITDFNTGGLVGGKLLPGTWPAGVTLNVNSLIILGAGGSPRTSSKDGGDAVDVTSYPVVFNSCYIAGGGGAGGSAYYGPGFGDYWADGGGGAGYPLSAGSPGGTRTAGGVTFAGGGNGGNLGAAGQTGGYGPVSSIDPAGAAGRAVVGVANATLNTCTIVGATV